jgi:predicted DNA-binding ribbon-helix-helix protein
MPKDRGLKTRFQISSSIEKGLWTALKGFSEKTKVPISKLLDEAIEDLLAKRKGR